MRHNILPINSRCCRCCHCCQRLGGQHRPTYDRAAALSKGGYWGGRLGKVNVCGWRGLRLVAPLGHVEGRRVARLDLLQLLVLWGLSEHLVLVRAPVEPQTSHLELVCVLVLRVWQNHALC